MPPPRTALQMTPRLFLQNKKDLPEQALPEQRKKIPSRTLPIRSGTENKKNHIEDIRKSASASGPDAEALPLCLCICVVSASVSADFHSPDQDSAAVMIDME